MKWDRSALITLVYGLFVLLYAVYIAMSPGYFGDHKGRHWGYFLEFLLVSNYCYFILQGLVLRSKNWGLLLLLPPVILAAAIATGYLLVGLIRLGGGDLLNRDSADMVLGVLLLLVGTYFSLRFIRPGSRRINRAGKKR